MSEKTFVAIGTSTVPDYSFLAPLTALMWREVVGHEPIIFVVGNDLEKAGADELVSALDELDVESYCVGEIEGYSVGTIAQNVRQHAAAQFGANEDDSWIMTADADLWPIRREFYWQHAGLNPSVRAVSYYSNGDHFQGKRDVLAKFDAEVPVPFQSIPTCHVAMRARDWREVYGIKTGNVIEATKKTLDGMEPWLKRFAPDHQGLARWCCDQWYLTERLCRQEWFPDRAIPHPCPPGGRILQDERVKLIERYGHPPLDRLDRGCMEAWHAVFDPARWTDAHLHKNPYGDVQWKTILKIIDALLPQRAAWAREYHDRFVEAMK